MSMWNIFKPPQLLEGGVYVAKDGSLRLFATDEKVIVSTNETNGHNVLRSVTTGKVVYDYTSHVMHLASLYSPYDIIPDGCEMYERNEVSGRRFIHRYTLERYVGRKFKSNIDNKIHRFYMNEGTGYLECPMYIERRTHPSFDHDLFMSDFNVEQQERWDKLNSGSAIDRRLYYYSGKKHAQNFDDNCEVTL